MNHHVSFTDQDIAAAFALEKIEHTDAPTEDELCRVRERLCHNSILVSLNWLRNRIVQLRKGKRLNVSDEPNLFN